MKKKLLFVVIALALALLCLAACNVKGDNLQDIASALHDVKYSEVTVNVSTEKNGVKLEGEYVITFDGDSATVRYSFDKLNELNMEDNPADYITKVEGVATVQNGEIVGDNVSLENVQIDYTGFNFKSAFFSQVTRTGAQFEATVSNPQAFVGNSQFVGTNMHVTATIMSGAFSSLTVEYVSQNGAAVKAEYAFTRAAIGA